MYEVLRDFRVNTWHLEMSCYLRIVRQGRALIIYYGVVDGVTRGTRFVKNLLRTQH